MLVRFLSSAVGSVTMTASPMVEAFSLDVNQPCSRRAFFFRPRAHPRKHSHTSHPSNPSTHHHCRRPPSSPPSSPCPSSFSAPAPSRPPRAHWIPRAVRVGRARLLRLGRQPAGRPWRLPRKHRPIRCCRRRWTGEGEAVSEGGIKGAARGGGTGDALDVYRVGQT